VSLRRLESGEPQIRNAAETTIRDAGNRVRFIHCCGDAETAGSENRGGAHIAAEPYDQRGVGAGEHPMRLPKRLP
jgi:hypothetical protein